MGLKGKFADRFLKKVYALIKKKKVDEGEIYLY